PRILLAPCGYSSSRIASSPARRSPWTAALLCRARRPVGRGLLTALLPVIFHAQGRRPPGFRVPGPSSVRLGGCFPVLLEGRDRPIQAIAFRSQFQNCLINVQWLITW